MRYRDFVTRWDFGRGYDYTTHYRDMPGDLAKLDDLDEYEVAEYETDPRGWDVIGRDGEKIGKIENLLVSPSTMKAYFAIVDTGGWFNDKKFALPLANVTFDRDDRKVHAPYAKEQFQGAPEWTGTDRDYDRYHTYWGGFGPEAFATPERYDEPEVGETPVTRHRTY